MFDTADIRSPHADDLRLLQPDLTRAPARRMAAQATPRPRAATPAGAYARVGKRALDIALSIVGLAVAAPLIVVFALLVALDGKSPFFVQERVGRGGRVFRMLKLRSMVADAEAALAQHLAEHPEAAREWDLRQKLTDDPRITGIGHFLRRTSLDELPQLVNVLKGDMSLVGPRPMLPCQQSIYPGTAYYALRPGITGLWQVSERHGSEFARRADYDQRYLDELSFGLDVETLGRTVAVVLRGTGC